MISMNWVKDYINLDGEDLNELAVKVTNAGVNVEHVISNHIDNLVIGEVIKCVNHENSDHLHVCDVNIGKETTQIVCGAPNVREGLKVIVALPGAVLPGNFEIKKSKIRGVESNGMICALFELGLEEKTEENYNKGIHELPSDAPIGSDPLEYLGVCDTLYDLDIHKHRNNDCTNHIGFAYELASILGKKVTLPDESYSEIDDDINSHFNLNVDTDNCTYYSAKMVTDLKIGESPEFIKRRLISAGMRPINNIVDISNYVMLEYGQPLHFFDKDKLGNNVLVRMAKDNEEVITLDNKERILNENDIVITDGSKVVAIAGVMGALNTDIDENTKTILIESAIFDSKCIRYTSRNLNLRSEASSRYEKELNYEYTISALNRACHLLEKYASGKVLKGSIIHDKVDKTKKIVEFKKDEINSLLGMNMSNDDISNQLEKLGFNHELKDNKFKVIIPNRRLDIDNNMADIAEEIGRLYGYHNLENTLPITKTTPGKYADDVYLRKVVSKRLRNLGLNETRTYTLVNPKMANMFSYEHENINLPNPMSTDKSVIRKSILPSLINVIDYNKARGVKDINLYEISKVYYDDFNEETNVAVAMYGNYMSNQWQGLSVKTDFYLIKGIVENLLDYLGFKNRYSFEESNIKDMHPGVCADILIDRKKVGFLGKIHPATKKDEIYLAEISLTKLDTNVKPLKFREISKFPKIEKDLAFIVNKNMKSSEIESVIKKSGGKLLKGIKVFDVYTGENVDNDKKSIAFNLVFEDNTKTLTDEEVNKIFNKMISDVEGKLPAKLRNM